MNRESIYIRYKLHRKPGFIHYTKRMNLITINCAPREFLLFGEGA